MTHLQVRALLFFVSHTMAQDRVIAHLGGKLVTDSDPGYWLEPNGPLLSDPGPDKAFTFEGAFDPRPRG